MRALVLLGPNLGALGTRDPERYGSETLQDLRGSLETWASEMGHAVEVAQSDHEGDLVGRLLSASGDGFGGSGGLAVDGSVKKRRGEVKSLAFTISIAVSSRF